MDQDDRAEALSKWMEATPEKDRLAFVRWLNRLKPHVQDAVLAHAPIDDPEFEVSLNDEVAVDSEDKPSSLDSLLSPQCDRNVHRCISLPRLERLQIRDVVRSLPPEERETAILVMRYGMEYVRAIKHWPAIYYQQRLSRLRKACMARGLEYWPSETRPRPRRCT